MSSPKALVAGATPNATQLLHFRDRPLTDKSKKLKTPHLPVKVIVYPRREILKSVTDITITLLESTGKVHQLVTGPFQVREDVECLQYEGLEKDEVSFNTETFKHLRFSAKIEEKGVQQSIEKVIEVTDFRAALFNGMQEACPGLDYNGRSPAGSRLTRHVLVFTIPTNGYISCAYKTEQTALNKDEIAFF